MVGFRGWKYTYGLQAQPVSDGREEWKFDAFGQIIGAKQDWKIAGVGRTVEGVRVSGTAGIFQKICARIKDPK